MVPVTQPFPLLKLPYLALRNILEMMSFIDQLKSSLCSRRLKLHIRSLFLKSRNLTLALSRDELSLSVHAKDFHHLQFVPFNFTLQGPSSIRYTSNVWPHQETEQLSSGFDVKGWVRHLAETFNCNDIGLNFICDSYDIEHVKQVIQGLNVFYLVLHNSLYNDYLVNALEAFQPTKWLTIYQKPEKEEPFLHDIITRKYRSICLAFPMTLEEILTLTSESIQIDSMSPADLNTLLKKWIDGWNPELSYLSTSIKNSDDDYFPVIFEGLQLQKSQENEERQMKRLPSWHTLQRADGMVAEFSIIPTSPISFSFQIEK